MSENHIKILNYSFDPLEESSISQSDVVPINARWIIQFKKPLDRENRRYLQQKYRLKLDHYIPKHAYLEQISAGVLKKLVEDKLYRAHAKYKPEYKISPTIGRHKYRTEDRQKLDGLFLYVVAFPSANSEQTIEHIKSSSGEVLSILDDRKQGGKLKFRVKLGINADISRLAEIEDVEWIEEITEFVDDNVNAATTVQSGTAGTGTIWNQNLNGQGQIIGIMDSGPADINHCFFQDPVNNIPNPAHRKVVALRNVNGDASGGHATFTAGNAAGDDFNNPGTNNRRGGAWGARLAIGNRFDLTLFSGTASMFSELNDAASAGAFIHTNSWHENNVDGSNQAIYSQVSVDTDNFIWLNEDHLVFGSAGNNGEEQGAPGTAKNAICVAAAQADPNENNLGDGNPGPTADGRRKPDLVTVGCNIQSATVGTACGTGTRAACATSYATPHAAAAAAMVRQYFTEGWYPTGTPQPHHSFIPSGALMKAILLNSTRNMTGTGVNNIPDANQGWGIVRLDDVLYFPGGPLNLRVWDTRNADGIATEEAREHHVDVATNTQRLKATLVWSEPPSAVNSGTSLVNDLDLQVISPDGTQVFRGNNFSAAGVSTTGGGTDNTENIEMVVINNPAPGDWTINVFGTAVNVGNPGQGFSLVVTADLTEAPVSVGDQDTLVVRVKFSDVAFEPPLPNLQNTITEAANYINEVSYGQATIDPLYRGAIELDNPKSYYYHPERSLLVELVEEVVAKLVAAEPNIFDQGANDIDRMVIVTNDINFTEDWATTGDWPYNMPGGFTRPISVSVQSYANGTARFTHGLLHQFGLVDLYAHPGVIFPRPYVDEWDNMSNTFTNVHPLVWSKQRANWVTSHGSTIEYIPRPAAGNSYTGTNPIPLFFQEDTNPNRKAIAIGMTQGAATIAAENAFYYVEARSNTLGGADDALPSTGVIVYYVNELIPQGQGPVIVRDEDLTTASLGDAALEAGDIHTIPGTGITLTVLAGTVGAEDFNIQVDYTPPVTNYNVRITKGDTINGNFYSYYSPDIWVDSPRNGFDLAAGPPAHDNRDNPVVGMVNRIYARITNDGPATAFDFDVRFRISEPYHTVGGVADFDTFVGIAHIDSLAPGGTNVFVEWTPASGADNHTCVLVDIINLVGNDTNPNDNEAQENLRTVTSVTGSPFHPVVFDYDLTNPYEESSLFYFRLDGLPKGWKAEMNPKKILLNPGERMSGFVKIRPPEKGKYCISEIMEVTSWTPRGDTLIQLGGAVVKIDLKRPTAITVHAGWTRCKDEDWKQLYEEAKKRGEDPNMELIRKLCQKMHIKGCTNPPMKNQEVVIKITDQAGDIQYVTVMTDENGCYEYLHPTVEDGNWSIEVELDGDRCHGESSAGPIMICHCRH